ncbi:MAG TPA: ABC transporter ATP-binding protein [Candidatus Dormibacteraeota bacterium]|nr:ABC transporter ATP-binding protein [Candidatus Dormibacteraeota bacterium]
MAVQSVSSNGTAKSATAGAAALLDVEGLTVRYGGQYRAVADVSFSVGEGEMLAVLGPNGAGKSSVARALAGLVKTSGGRISYAGEDVSAMPPHRRSRMGLVYIPEGRGVFPTLTVMENLRLATRTVSDLDERRAMLDRVFTLFPVLASRSKQSAGTLSGGEQQMLALARAVGAGARLVIADELSLGLAPLLVDVVFQSIALAKQQGTSVILIEQFVDRALRMADRCLILGRGRVVWSGLPGEAGHEVRARYLGRSE